MNTKWLVLFIVSKATFILLCMCSMWYIYNLIFLYLHYCISQFCIKNYISYIFYHIFWSSSRYCIFCQRPLSSCYGCEIVQHMVQFQPYISISCLFYFSILDIVFVFYHIFWFSPSRYCIFCQRPLSSCYDCATYGEFLIFLYLAQYVSLFWT